MKPDQREVIHLKRPRSNSNSSDSELNVIELNSEIEVRSRIRVNIQRVLDNPLTYSRDVIEDFISRYDNGYNIRFLMFYIDIEKTDSPLF